MDMAIWLKINNVHARTSPTGGSGFCIRDWRRARSRPSWEWEFPRRDVPVQELVLAQEVGTGLRCGHSVTKMSFSKLRSKFQSPWPQVRIRDGKSFV